MLDAENQNADESAPTTDSVADPTQLPADTPPSAAESTGDSGAAAPAKKTAKKAPAKKTAAKKSAAKKTTAKRVTRKTAAPATAGTEPAEEALGDTTGETAGEAAPPAKKAAARKTAAKKTAEKAAAKRTTRKSASAPVDDEPAGAEQAPAPATPAEAAVGEVAADEDELVLAQGAAGAAEDAPAGPPAATALLFQPPDPTKAVPARKRATRKAGAPKPAETTEETAEQPSGEEQQERPRSRRSTKKAATPSESAPVEEATTGEDLDTDEDQDTDEQGDEQGGERRRRRRGGRRRRRSGGGDGQDGREDGGEDSGRDRTGDQAGDQSKDKAGDQAGDQADKAGDQGDDTEDAGTGSRRRRRRRRSGEGDGSSDDTGTGGNGGGGGGSRARKTRNAEDEITSLSGSTRLEAKKQRRREGREAGRRRAPIVSEAEFLARREAVDRVMVVRQRKDLTQIAVLEDKVLVEHYVARESQTSLIGNVYLGRVQNVLPSMEAAFIDIGKGRNAVLYAGEVNWDSLGAKNGTPRKIEAVLKSGQPILVQVTKDPIGHKGARLTSQVSLPGRFLVYVPDGTTSGISRKLPDTERNRLKTLLKEIVPESAGVIVRTAAEGASEEELTRDVERLTARWADIESKVEGGNAPQLLYGEPDLTLKVVRDLFTEDFSRLVVSGDDAWDLVENYVSHVAPDLAERLERYDAETGGDVFSEYRIDEQIEKALDRKVWLPSGGSLVVDRTEAMTVVDVNTGKFTGSGGNLEETVTKNNLEAAEEIVRQLRLRDIGGIIVVDFIDMVLESNRDLVLRRMVECLGRDRTRHQVAEVTSLGLVQMTRKRIGTGLLEAFSENCEHCQGRGLVLHHEPVEPRKKGDDDARRGGGRRSGRGRGRDGDSGNGGGGNGNAVPSPKDIAAIARHEDRTEERPEHRADTPAAGKTQADGQGAAPTGVTPQEQDAQQSQQQGDQAGAPQDDERGAQKSAGVSQSDQQGDQQSEQQDRQRVSDGAGTFGAAGAEQGESDAGARRPRSRGGRSRGRSRAGQAEAPAEGQEAEAAETGVTEPPAEGQQAEPAVGESAASQTAPRESAQVRTQQDQPAEAPAAGPVRTGRRSASRPQGAPAGSGDAAVTAITVVGEPAASAEETKGGAEPAAGPEAAGTPATPRVVTTVRRRSARRPAGPPAGTTAGSGSPADTDVAQLEQADGVAAAGVSGAADEAPEGSSTPHVPVKKKGSRRR